MNQWEYDTILMALDGGVPAIADKLGSALQGLVTEANKLRVDNAELKRQLEELKSSKCDCECQESKPEEKDADKKVVKKPPVKKAE
jgi:regulator of replication initiation timing